MLGGKLARTDEEAAATKEGSKAQNPVALLVVQGENANFQGKFQVTDSVEIQCEIGGELEVGGELVIGENGVVNADVQTVDAVIMGSYEGNMTATGHVRITSTGKVQGNIKTNSLVISKGGFFNGNVSRIKDNEPVKLVEEPAEEPAAQAAAGGQKQPAYHRSDRG